MKSNKGKSEKKSKPKASSLNANDDMQRSNRVSAGIRDETVKPSLHVIDAGNYAEAIVATIREPLVVLDKNLRIKTANSSFYKTFQVNEREIGGQLIYDIGNGQWNIPTLRTLLENVLPETSSFEDFEVTYSFPDNGPRVMLLSACEIISGEIAERLILLSMEDVTEKATARKRIEDSNKHYHDMLMHSPFAFSVMKGKEMKITLANNLIKEIWGKGDEVEWKTLLEVLPELEDQAFPAMIDSVYTTGEPVSANEIVVRLNYNGKVIDRYFNIVYYPYLEADGTISGVVTIANEVTTQVIARKKIEESEHRYHNMVYTSPSMIAIFKGEDMTIEVANDAILESWGKGKSIIGKSLFEVMPESVEQGFDKLLLSVYTTGEPVYSYETPITLVRNGKKQLMHYTFVYQAQRDINDEIEGVAVLANEVTTQVEAKDKLKESEKRLSNLVEKAPSPICILKGENMVLEVANEPVFKIWNIEKDALGKPFLEIIPEMKDQPFMGWLLNVFRNGVTHYGNEEPAYFIRENGDKETIYFNFVYQPYHEDDGSISGVMVLANDVTEQVLARKKIEESEKHFRLLADLMPSKISNANKHGDGIYFNKQWLDYSGYNFEELKDFGYHKMLHPDELEEFQSRLQKAVATGTVLEMEMRFRNKEGDYKWHINLAAPVKDEAGNINMWVGVTTEIQEQKEKRAQLEKAVAERTFELQYANENLEEKNKELQKLNKELASFAYVSSHDLQEPLRKIQTFANLITQSELAVLSEKGKDYFYRMRSAARRMQTLIEDLLAYSHTSNNERSFERTDPGKIIEEVRAELEETILEKNATIDIIGLCHATLNASQFRQVMHNLIGNSLKFASPERPLHIIIQTENVEGNQVEYQKLFSRKNYCHISVSDNGIGFDPQYKDQIFEVFQRLHGKEEYAGTGIGLAIVKKIIENHDGKIVANGELGKGATFDIYIPTC